MLPVDLVHSQTHLDFHQNLSRLRLRSLYLREEQGVSIAFAVPNIFGSRRVSLHSNMPFGERYRRTNCAHVVRIRFLVIAIGAKLPGSIELTSTLGFVLRGMMQLQMLAYSK